MSARYNIMIYRVCRIPMSNGTIPSTSSTSSTSRTSRTSYTLQPSLPSAMNILPFLFTDMLSVRDMYRLMCTSKDFAWVARTYINMYIQLWVVPRISLYVEGVPVKFDGFGAVGGGGGGAGAGDWCGGFRKSPKTRLMFMCRPRYLLRMPGKHEIRCEIAVGTDVREISTTKSLLFHDFSTGLKSYIVSSPISLFSSGKIQLIWEDLIGTDDEVDDPMPPSTVAILSPDKLCDNPSHHNTIFPTTYAGTMGFRWYTKLFRYLTRWRDKRHRINSIPCITHITMDVPGTFLSINPIPISTVEAIRSFAVCMVSNTVIYSAILGVGYWLFAIGYWFTTIFHFSR